MKYRDPFDFTGWTLEPRRSMFLDAPSGNPLHEVDLHDRAVFLLLEAGEDPKLVGRQILRAPKTLAVERACDVARRVAAEAFTERKPSLRAGALRDLLPDHRHRWVILLRVSGAFPQVGEVARVLRVERTTAYRRLQAATRALSRELQRRRSG